jgi:polyribonucleotide nucleotidyltransferase
MFNEVIKTVEYGKHKLTLKTGKFARQAEGAVIAEMGKTVVLCTVAAERAAKEGVDFFPLSVHYKEMSSAAGKIPGGFIKREGKPSDREVLISRLIDRPIRPLFPDGFYNETQILCTVLSHDPACSPDIVAIIGASAALSLSGLPYESVIAAARIGYIDGEYVLNPTYEELKESRLELIVAGTDDSIMMVESGASELNEKNMLEALEFGHKSFQPVIKAIKELEKEAGKDKWVIEKKDFSSLESHLKNEFGAQITAAYKIPAKRERRDLLKLIQHAALEKYATEAQGYTSLEVAHTLEKIKSQVVRESILNSQVRIDGRKAVDIRPIECEVGLLPKTHGSSLFTRGETQALVITTLGTTQDEQILDGLEGEQREHFMLQYSFPPYSVGEVGRMSGPGRREIGHGRLAWRAIQAVLPERTNFPYAYRVVSEITSCNGSSSMATVCGASLSMMDAGVPLKAPVAGIAMGLIMEDKKFTILSDILGDEDALGDMDFKVTGTTSGITALQMDIKVSGITLEIMRQALEQARVGRLHILGEMDKAIKAHRTEVSEHAPIIKTVQINKDKIRELIGPGGKVIKDICEKTGAKIDISDEGLVQIATVGAESLNKALAMVNDIVGDPEVGKIYEGTVVKIIDSGAFVNFFGSKDGFLHISEISEIRVTDIKDHIKVGDKVEVKLVGFDKGKSKLSIKQAKAGNTSSGNNGGNASAATGNAGSPKQEVAREKNWTLPKKQNEEELQGDDQVELVTERKYFN